MSLDATLDEVQNSRFRNIYNQLVKQYEKKSQFNEVELFCILLVYHKFALRNGMKAKYITKKQLANVFEVFFKISEVFTVERITSIIAKDTKKEIEPIGWLNLFEVFMTNDLETKMKFCFQVYDFHGAKGLNREAVTKYVEKFFKSDDEDEAGELVVVCIHKIIFICFFLSKRVLRACWIFYSKNLMSIRMELYLLKITRQLFVSSLFFLSFLVRVCQKPAISLQYHTAATSYPKLQTLIVLSDRFCDFNFFRL